MKSRKKMILGASVLLLFATAAFVWAFTPAQIYNRPTPLMDYAPQEIGIYDTLYMYLGETDCRICHGNSLADRHHYSETALTGTCTACHAVDPNSPNGIVVTRDCSAAGCHLNYDNGWHHLTDESYTDQCIACHDPGTINRVSQFQSFVMYPPSVVTPTPFSCENCHWEQPVVAATPAWIPGDPTPNPSDAGHPSTANHHDPYDQYWHAPGSDYGSFQPGPSFGYYYEYGKPIMSNYDTHHMLFGGNVSTDCARCHSQDPENPSWDPYNPELIRYCETCHGISSLHTIEPHVGPGGTGNPDAVHGWVAEGFHLPDVTNTNTADVAPTVIKTFTANEQCYGCHADLLPTYIPDTPPAGPSFDATTPLEPQVGTCYSVLTVNGADFGSVKTSQRNVKIRLTTTGSPWNAMPIVSWSNDQILFQIPCWTYATGNYYVAVETEVGWTGIDPNAVFILTDSASLTSVTPTQGACREILTVAGNGFGASQDQVVSGNGTYTVVRFEASQGEYVATVYGGPWSDTGFKVMFGDVFEDTNGNFIRDSGEPLIRQCESLGLGIYSVYVSTVLYQDDDTSGTFTAGDTIYSVADSDAKYFELVTKPVVYLINPYQLEPSHYCGSNLKNGIMKIWGWGFGPTQGTDGHVYIGTSGMYPSGGVELTRTAWSDTIIQAGVDMPAGCYDCAVGLQLYLWVEKGGVYSDASYGYPGFQVLTQTCP